MVFVKWFILVIPIGLFGLLTEWLMFFPAWFLRNLKINPFWIWLDDSRFGDTPTGFALDYNQHLNGKKENIWSAYNWHLRNSLYNLKNIFKPATGNFYAVDIKVDELYMNGQKVNQLLSWCPMARLKYWSGGVEGHWINKGESISKRHSIFGKGYFTYKKGGRRYFRYSYVKEVNYLVWKGYRVFVAGWNNDRAVLSIKHNNFKRIV